MLVSVIIPTYNRARTIRRAVDSVLKQTWEEIEIIVVDDGSTDNTFELLAQYGDKIRVIRQSNQRQSAARNNGIKAAKGEIISFLDSDDSWMPEKIERQVKLLQCTQSSGVACCICNARMIFTNGRGETTSFAAANLNPECVEGIWKNPAEVLMTRFLLFNQVVALRREVLDQAGYFRPDLRINEDYDLEMRLALMGPWAFIAEPLAIWYGSHENTESNTASTIDQCRTALDILKDLGDSRKWGPLFPQRLLRRQRRALSQHIAALQLLEKSNAMTRLASKFLLLYIRLCGTVYRLRYGVPQMIAQEVIKGSASIKTVQSVPIGGGMVSR